MLAGIAHRSASILFTLSLLLAPRAEAKSGEGVLDEMVHALVAMLGTYEPNTAVALSGAVDLTITSESLGSQPIEIKATYKSRPPADFMADLTTSLGNYRIRANRERYVFEATADTRYYQGDRAAMEFGRKGNTTPRTADLEKAFRELLGEFEIVRMDEVTGAPGGKAWKLDLRPKNPAEAAGIARSDLYVLQRTGLPWKIQAYAEEGRERFRASVDYVGDLPSAVKAKIHDHEEPIEARFDLSFDAKGEFKGLEGTVTMGKEGSLDLKATSEQPRGLADADFSYRPGSAFKPATEQEMTVLVMTRLMGLAFGSALLQGFAPSK
ncbi:MAG: hypothetical protein CME06_03705 [Gemmatimonadetes bacterium]|nr:hypothetical protein [Gemmatimonadota bacterium]